MVERRTSIRALIMDPADDALLLMRMQFPAWRRSHWMTPGGGMDPGETERESLEREVREETGLALDADTPVTGPVWTRRIQFEFRGIHYDQREHFYLIRTPRFEPHPAGNPVDHEVDALLGYGWWTPAAIAASDEGFLPRELGSHLRTLLIEGPPAAPVDVGI